MADPRTPASLVDGVPRGTVLVAAVAIGVAGDLLLRGSVGIGPNLVILFVLLAAALGLSSRRAGMTPSTEALSWVVVGLLFACALMVRASPSLQALALLAAAAAFAFPALRSGAAWLQGSGVSDQVEAIGSAVLHAAMGPLPLLLDRRGSRTGVAEVAGGPRGTLRPAVGRQGWGAIFRGIVLASPLLLVFGALLLSADPVFAGIVTGLLPAVDLEEFASRLLVIGVLTWLASGYLLGFLWGTRIRGRLEPLTRRPSLGILETGTVLALVDLLFAAFILVQLRYLFGGSGLVEVTPGLTYSEYAREGFAQLIVAAGLALPCLLAADWLLERRAARDDQVFRLLGSLQLVLLGVIIASALQRIRVYHEAYGLTESRLYGAVFLAWLAFLLIWFGATVLRGARERFASVALISAFGMVALLLAVNPDERIARTNLARAEGLAPSAEFDTAYLASLSSDAVPALIQALPEMSPEHRCRLAREVHRRWGTESTGDWRSWNLSRWRAHHLVLEASPDLSSPIGCPDAEDGP